MLLLTYMNIHVNGRMEGAQGQSREGQLTREQLCTAGCAEEGGKPSCDSTPSQPPASAVQTLIISQ